MSYTVGVIVGSISSTSINARLASALPQLAPADTTFVTIAIDDLPLYSPDYDSDYPAAGRALKEAIAAVDALLVITPEYNRSIPGVLKNAIDWASRPWGQNSFDGKPAGILGATVGTLGTALAQMHLRHILAFSNADVLGQPEGYLSYRDGLIDDDGTVTDPSVREFLTSWIQAFDTHVRKHLGS